MTYICDTYLTEHLFLFIIIYYVLETCLQCVNDALHCVNALTFIYLTTLCTECTMADLMPQAFCTSLPSGGVEINEKVHYT